ncbi:MAG TPA: hypothetical protein VEA37_14710, partial [Flavobacterium sp.]|nr:hypothetical protein [Flavobacterium sp.]
MRKLLLTLLLLLGTLGSYAQSDISVFSNNPDNAYVDGETLTWSIIITNNGPDPAANVNVFFDIPDDIPIPANPTPGGIITFWWEGPGPSSGTNANLNHFIPSLAVDQTVTYTLHLKIPEDYTSELPDVLVTWATQSDIEVINTDSLPYYVPGEASVYTVTVTNHGPE